jgi:hypothetical protein
MHSLLCTHVQAVLKLHPSALDVHDPKVLWNRAQSLGWGITCQSWLLVALLW